MAVHYDYDPTEAPFVPLKVPAWFGSIEPPVNAIRMGQEADERNQQQALRDMAIQSSRMKLDEMIRDEQANAALGEWVRQNQAPTHEALLTRARDEYANVGAVDNALKIAHELQQMDLRKELARDQEISRAEQRRDRDLSLVGTLARVNPVAAYSVARGTGLADVYGLTQENLTPREKPRAERKPREPKATDLKEYVDTATGEKMTLDIYSPITYQGITSGRLKPVEKESAFDKFVAQQLTGGSVPQVPPQALPQALPQPINQSAPIPVTTQPGNNLGRVRRKQAQEQVIYIK